MGSCVELLLGYACNHYEITLLKTQYCLVSTGINLFTFKNHFYGKNKNKNCLFLFCREQDVISMKDKQS